MITEWFHDEAHGRMEAVANQVQQVWADLVVYAAAKIIINTCPTCHKSLLIKLNCEIDHEHFSHSKDCKWII